MKKIVLITIAFILFNNYVSAKETLSEILDKAITGVVLITIPENTGETPPRIFGIAKSKTTEPAYNWKLGLNKTGASGFIVESKGKKYIITNVHVIQCLDQEDIKVYCHDGKEYQVRVLGGDTFYDIAVLEFVGEQPGDDKIPLNFRSEDKPMQIGEDVYAIGHPLLEFGNHQFTVTNGIISGKGRIIEGLTCRFGQIQHTAFLANGNSGGPLIDSEGKIIGLNTSIRYAPTGFLEDGTTRVNIPQFHMNFSTEFNIIRSAFENILVNKKVLRAFLGIELRETKRGNYIDKFDVRIAGIIDDSPAIDKLEVNSKIKKILNQEINCLDDALQALESIQPNSTVEIQIEYLGTPKDIKIKASELNDINLEKIANYLIESYTNYVVFQENDIVYLANSRFKNEKNKIIAVAGASTDKLWLVESLADLGKIIRLTSMAGGINIGYYDKYLDDVNIILFPFPSIYTAQKILMY